jgi:SAM-dependent methyltransferase
MNEHDKKACINRYNERLQKHGYSVKTLGWGGDKARQELRFRTALELVNHTEGKITSVLDVGCGFGDFGEYMSKAGLNIAYKGIDINPTLVKVGKEKYPKLDLSVNDVLLLNNVKYDLVMASGIFSYELKKENIFDYINRMTSKFYEFCNVGVYVDFMSTYVDFKHPNAFHYPEYHAFDLGKRLSKRVVLRNDYLDYEYCLYIIKDYGNK